MRKVRFIRTGGSSVQEEVRNKEGEGLLKEGVGLPSLQAAFLLEELDWEHARHGGTHPVT